MTRRSFLEKLTLGVCGSLIPGWLWASINRSQERILHLYSINTGESLKVVYWMEGQYLESSLREVFHLLRDYRSGEVHPIDVHLLDLLYVMRTLLEKEEPIHVISGYRSPQTNEALRYMKRGVAKDSYHTRGMAVDVSVPGVPLRVLRNLAISLRMGGVGYYPGRFVHLDTGPFRTW